jgi:diguanylate cyclase (GGDEF)-like protein
VPITRYEGINALIMNYCIELTRVLWLIRLMAKAKILLIEDSKAQADVTRAFLEKSGYEVVWANDGISGIKAVKSTFFDVILLDLVLPDMNGNEICRWLKLNNDTKGIPTIMLTVKSSLDDKVSSLEAGADEYLAKPYNEVELNVTIYAALRTKALQDELKQKNKQMEGLLTKVEVLAITDPLTGLYNRRYFDNILKKELTERKRYGQSVTCLMMDIDHFKQVNDTYGHEAGDFVLKDIAALLKTHLREVDTIARWGGEEFTVMMPHTDINGAFLPASRILKTIADKTFDKIPDAHITVSIGLACTGETQHTPDTLVNAADLALYEAKKKGRNRIEVAPEE